MQQRIQERRSLLSQSPNKQDQYTFITAQPPTDLKSFSVVNSPQTNSFFNSRR